MKSYILKNLAQKVLPAYRYYSLAKWWQFLSNIGFTHQCPICGKHVKTFLPFGFPARPNAKCPFCESLERHRSLWLFISYRTDLFSGGLTVLHLAPEPCLKTKLSRLSGVHYVAADLDPTLATISLDVQLIPFKNDSFDCILCSHVLEHVPDDRKAMREIFRVLKMGGWAILQVPLDGNRDETFEDTSITSAEEREKIFGQRDHVRIYGKDYKQRLADVGFIVQFDSYIKELRKDIILKYGLSTEDIFLVRKPKNCAI